MTKIALTTKYSAYNFGAMLQTYALQRVINQLGAECLVVDADRQKRPGIITGYSPSALVNNLFYRIHKSELESGYLKFESFMDSLPLTERYKDYEALCKNPPRADVYLSGSDQVWNPMRVSDNYFLRFAPKDAVRASYAASLGVSYLPAGCRAIYSEYLHDFDYISVREQDAKEIIREQVGIETQVNIDPVFLLSKDEWSEIAKMPDIKTPYILCYILYRPVWLNDWLKKIHRIIGKKIVVITVDAFRNIYKNKMIRDAGPLEMVGLIQQADFVISSSFHGVALSIVNKKPFYAVVNQAAPSRIQNLLNTFHLEDRAVSDGLISELKPLDYSRVEKILQSERDKAIDYLKLLVSNPPKKPHVLKEESDIYKRGDTISILGNSCTGCKACESVCPVGAISFYRDSEGFNYPHVDDSICVRCGNCVKNCHAIEKNKKNTKESCTAYYGWNKNISVVGVSSSGGVFTSLADYVISKDGLVIGAYFDAKTKTVYHGNSDQIDMQRFKKSKYVESDLSDTYTWIAQALSKDRYVLFCGTPCQCAGIRKRFGYHDKLLLVDFFCHGVPSPKVFSDYLTKLEREKGEKLIDYAFRTKTFGWKQYGILKQYTHNRVETVGRCEFFYRSAMVDNLFLRKSCYTCDKALYHTSDITIGDFWGMNSLSSKENMPDGVSIFIVNGENGERIMRGISDHTELRPVAKHCLDYTFQAKKADKMLPKRDEAFEEYNRIGIDAFEKKYYAKKLAVSRVVFQLKKKKFKKIKKTDN